MARPRYPSDEARVKTRPHVRIHLTARTHRRTAEIFADPELRGILTGLWFVAREAYAGKTRNLVHLDRTAVMWITGRTQYAPALRALRALCARMEYAVSTLGALVVVEVRNFERKQDMHSASRGDTPPTPHASEEEEEEDVGRREEEPPLPPAACAAPAAKVNGSPKRLPARTAAPLELSAEQWERLWRLVWRNRPWLLAPGMEETAPHCHRRWVQAQVQETLSYWRREGKQKADWTETCLNRIYTLDGERWERSGEPPPIASVFHERYGAEPPA